MQYDLFLQLVKALNRQNVRFVLIGVGGANYYARSTVEVFTTQDRDLFLPLDPENLLTAWKASVDAGFELWLGDEPLGKPIDLKLARAVSSRRIVTTAIHRDSLGVDITLVMGGFEFEEIWNGCRTFRVENIDIPVARLAHIVQSKAHANRPKDRLFLETWRERLRDMLGEDETD